MGLFSHEISQNTKYSLQWNFELYVEYIFYYWYKSAFQSSLRINTIIKGLLNVCSHLLCWQDLKELPPSLKTRTYILE